MFTTIRSITATATRLPRATAVRTLRTTPFLLTENDPTKPNSYGHAVPKSSETLEGGMDVQSAGVQAGMKQKKDGKETQAEPYDTAAESAGGQEAPSRQKEDALADASTASQAAHSAGAFKDHRAGAQSSGEYAGEVGGKEEAAAPKVLAGVKQVLGLGTNKQEHQESKTGPGVSRQMHTSARWMAGGEDGKAFSGSKSEGSHKVATPDERLEGDQNEHLKHKSAGEADSGKGNVSRRPPRTRYAANPPGRPPTRPTSPPRPRPRVPNPTSAPTLNPNATHDDSPRPHDRPRTRPQATLRRRRTPPRLPDTFVEKSSPKKKNLL